MSRISIARLWLRFSEFVNGNSHAHLLRGAIASVFPEEILLHQHKPDGVIYRYPLVQYRWRDGNGIIIGFHEGANLLSKLPLLARRLQLGGSIVDVTDVEARFSFENVQLADQLLRYRFMTPWLPFDQTNFEKYRTMTQNQKAEERDRIAVGNLLTALRGLRVEFPGRLYASIQVHRAATCRYKDQRLLGFTGMLLTNALLPNDIAIGRAVSHGYGWLKRIGNESG